jgi:hypothetical protein
VTDYFGIEGIRLKAIEVQADPDVAPDTKALFSLVGTLCSSLVDQSHEHLEALERQVLYLEHLNKTRNSLWQTLHDLVAEVRALNARLEHKETQLDEALKVLVEFLPNDDEEEVTA